MSTLQIGLVTSLFTLGGLLGALASGPFAARFGRLSAMRYNTTFFILGPIAEALAPSVAIMALGRFISGLGAGAAVVVVPIYVSEIAPPAAKGFFGSFTQVMTCIGIVFAQLLGLFLSRSQVWRVILAVGGLFGLAQLAGLTLAIESPTWSADHGEYDAARRDLLRIRGSTYDFGLETAAWEETYPTEQTSLLPPGARHESVVSTVSTAPSQRTPETLGIFEVLVHPRWAWPTVAVMVVMVAQQFAGINSIVFYGVALLADLLTTSSALINLLVSLFNLAVTVGCAPLSDRLGRKMCLIISLAGMGTSALLLAIAIHTATAPLSAVAVFAFVGSFGLGLGPVPFILASELVGPEAVGATQSWALAANWTATFVVAQFFPSLNKAMGKGNVYFLFAALATVFATFIAVFVPETRGKRDADEVWGRDARVRDRRDS